MEVITYTQQELNVETGLMVETILAVVSPAPDVKIEDCLCSVPEYAKETCKIVDSDSLPNRVLRDAWGQDSNGDSVVDIKKGQIVAHEIRREKRTEAMKENIELIKTDSAGIPLKAGKTATKAKSENAAFKKDIDDVMQTAIDAAQSESGLLKAIDL